MTSAGYVFLWSQDAAVCNQVQYLKIVQHLWYANYYR